MPYQEKINKEITKHSKRKVNYKEAVKTVYRLANNYTNAEKGKDVIKIKANNC